MVMKNTHTSHNSPLYVFSLVTMLLITLLSVIAGELTLHPQRLVVWSFLIVGSLLLELKVNFHQNEFAKRMLNVSIAGIFSLIVIHITLNLLDVYRLDDLSHIVKFCTTKERLCTIVTKLFFSFKIYRFITLSFSSLLSFLFLALGLRFNSLVFDKTFQNHFKVGNPILIILTFGTCTLLLSQVLKISDQLYSLTVKAWYSRNLSFEARFVPFEYGNEHHGWIWTYAEFVKVHVPEKSVLYIPPQTDTWRQEGNKYYFRWFMYPRELINFEDPFAPIPPTATHIVIANGGWKGGEVGWPKSKPRIDCIAEIQLIHRLTLVQQLVSVEEVDTIMTPDDWGVISLTPSHKSLCL